ncbi:Deoxyhypusine hydroxylase [Frankliniella fusca]|uniref:Deoxyhypusine hydroxylase n=1 Tax=Frankliniella fusca TaxID=407009 RepID=A0AAE1LAR1_9NEOP|nr:Deoxyhypusine hydroxylase [Frankliniella fusca]
MTSIDVDQVKAIGGVLNDPSRPLKERFRALFTLRNIGGSTAQECIKQCFKDPSALLKHELAYCLGQMQDHAAIPTLVSVLRDNSQEPMVRHEAGEALGALAAPDIRAILEEFQNDPVVEVAETCALALDRLSWVEKHKEDGRSENPYLSVDPTPPSEEKDVAKLRAVLLNENESLFNRYRAMFALRNLRSTDAVLALTDGLKAGSALFKHEVAFVLGQLQDPVSVPALLESLADKSENEMVRHECAEALGAIATEECNSGLEKHLHDEKRVVSESCIIALDMCEYENSPEFQYANTLLSVK